MTKLVDMSIEVLIFASLVGIIATQIATAENNTTGTTSTLIGLVTIFFVIAFINVVVKKAKGSK